MENLARCEYDAEADKKVKEELLTAGIPILELGVMDREVKTRYIGILNGFVFQRAWCYWVVKGNMPLQYAKILYEKHSDLMIRANGDCSNPHPERSSCNKDFDKLCQSYIEKYQKHEISGEELNRIGKELEAQGEQVIRMYHVDTQPGLCRLSEMIRKNHIVTEFVNGVM